MESYTDKELMLMENAYRQAQIDVQEILLELKTPANIGLMVEIDAKIHHAIQMRVMTQFAETKEEN